MRTLLAASLVAAFLLSGCETPRPVVVKPAEPPKPHAAVPVSMITVRDRLVERCAAAGFMVFESDDGSIICGVTIEGPEASPYLGRSGNPNAMPEQKVRFSLVQQGALVLVTADPWVELLTSTGDVRSERLENPRRLGQIQGLLNSLGRR